MALLWKPESWSQRLAELEARTGDLKEAPLRRDVRSLGMLLGEVLREQAGDALYEKVEELRQSTIQLSEDGATQRGSLRGTLREMKRVGIPATEALDWLHRIFIVPVFTAHPTEIARRSVLFKRRRIGEFLEDL